MAKTAVKRSAVDSAVGYYYQALYALVMILKADDGSSISVETDDDLTATDGVKNEKSLVQLKHSLSSAKALTVKSVGLWKAIANWAGRPLDGAERYLFATCAPLGKKSPLAALTEPNSDRINLLAKLVEEAEAVRDAAAKAKAANKKPPNAKRLDGCRRFLALGDRKRRTLLNCLTIMSKNFTASQVPMEVQKQLRSCVLPEHRPQLTERLIEWWDRQVVRSLLSERPRNIERLEVLNRISELIAEFGQGTLPDTFSFRKPNKTEEEQEKATTTLLRRQIEWVDGGPSRITRSILARWRARGQRSEWLKGGLGVIAMLNEFDDRLNECWSHRFGPMRDDCNGHPAATHLAKGLELLDWCHWTAPKTVVPIREDWKPDFLAQGTLQQMAQEGAIGWHPHFEKLVSEYRAAIKKPSKKQKSQ